MTSEYRQFLRLWQYINDLNQSDIYMYGRAVSDSSYNHKIVFDDDEQKSEYLKAFPRHVLEV